MSKSRDNRRKQFAQERHQPGTHPQTGEKGELIEVRQEVEHREHTGPLPAPEVLGEYDAVLPGLAERIVALTEREQQYRIEVNKKVLDANIRSRTLGQWLGAILSAIALGVAGFFGYMGSPVQGTILGCTVLGILGGLLYMKQRDMRRSATGQGGDLPSGDNTLQAPA